MSLTICEDTTIAELTEKIEALGYTNVKIYRNTSLTAANDLITWQSEPYYYRAQETGKCPSQLTPLTLTKETTNITPATARRFEVCLPQGQRPRISDLKASIGGDVRIFTRIDSRNWRLQADNAWVSLTGAYFYTIREAGKCPSEKTPLIVAVTYKTPTPSAPNAGNFCQGKTIADLKDYIDNTVNGTIRVYASNTATTPLTDTTVLTTTTYYYSTEETGRCESDRRAITIDLVATPTPRPIYTYCAGTKVETLWDDIDNHDSDRSLKIYENASGGTALARNTVLRAGYYYVAESSSSSSLGNCETSRAQLKVVLQNPVAPTVTTPQQFCSGERKTIADLSTATNLKWYTTSTGGTALAATTTLQSATYYASQVVGSCEGETRTPVVVSVTQTPDKPTFITTPESCAAPTQVIITNYQSGYTYWLNDNELAVDPVSHRITTLIRAGSYTIKAKNGSCESQASGVFRIKAQKTVPDAPTITLTAESCTAPTKAVIDNYESRQTYWYKGSQLTVDTTTHEITGLTPGTYIITTKNRNCESLGSASFVIKAQKTVPATPTVMELVAPTCTTIGVMKISNYDNVSYTFIKSADNTEVTGVTIGTDGVISNLPVGKYKVKAKKDGCESVLSTEFELKDKLVTPQVPTLTLTAESCTSPTKAVIDNYVSGQTYWYNGNQLTVNTTTHELMGLAAGTYTITTKNGSCESGASDSFEIKPQKTATTITTAPAGATYQKGTEATPLTVVATGEGTLSYKWYKNTNYDISTAEEVGDNSPSYKPATDTVGTFYYWVKVTSTCGTVTSAIAEIKVIEGAPTIEANDDPDTTVRRGGEVEILSNDKVNGNPATPSDVDITIPDDGGLTGIEVNAATGKLKIPTNAAPGTYQLTYQICVKGASSPCDTAKVKIIVEVPIRSLKAVDDDFGKIPNAVDYTTIATVFSSGVDTMEGVIGNLSPERDVILTPGAQPHANITMNANGSITVKRGTPKGTYSYEYTICQKDVPTNCDSAKVTFEVVEAHIFAKDDGVWEVGTEGALTPSILNNDIIGERVGVAPSEVTITKTNGKPVIDETKMVINEDGRISVLKNIPEGTYTYYYTITEKANIANSSSAVVTIKVVKFSAQDDEFELINDKTKENKTKSVLENDELNKKKNLSPVDDVILTKGEAKDGERKPTTALTMNDDGTITIAPNTPDGVYTYTYTICKKSAPTECKSAEAVIKLLPALVAEDDDFSGNPINPLVREGIVGNVLDNDRYADGKALEYLDKVVIKMLDNQNSRAHIEPNGDVVIPQGAPAGEYTLTYNLCMKDHPTICDEAKVKIVILEDKPLVIHNGISANADGQNDGFTIENIEGYPKNNLKIFNRWGVLVYEKDGYTNSEPFEGYSNGRATINAGSKLPQGTYYYILEYQDTAEQPHTEKGWLYLKY